ncbi:hypothetical protein C2G38_2231216 [Gigaspora rosea]|uniref:Uncharacterized protein n=1 Tax=Gigaspora rosea TaxID=44941 RepID=A0A397TV71_9GLOM|nr:hypothetical protein C2G38_2231216 [Gigaspora rosea]
MENPNITVPQCGDKHMTSKNDNEGTSGNKDVDDYIKEIQFKATEYGVVVEWSPFNRSNNIQKTSEAKVVTEQTPQWHGAKHEFQPKATEYVNVIEWVPFNRFDSIQRINKYEFSSIFLSQNG